jgi:CheY-like chemotaxis protein
MPQENPAILLVDDEDIIIDVTGLMLKQMGYEVFIANSGSQAIDVYKAHQPRIDLVILDMIMPGMGGSDTYDHLKAMDPDIRVILSSGYSLDADASAILDRGCNAFIQKPFDLQSLSEKIQNVLT